MRYYRVWIYACNIALLLGSLVFLVGYIWILTDFRMSLFSSVRLYYPSLLYGFVAIILQGGIVQVSLRQHLINVEWKASLKAKCSLCRKPVRPEQ